MLWCCLCTIALLFSLLIPTVSKVMAVLQDSLYKFEGNINKLLIDDKGFVVVAAFGLHPLRHEDDPVRATLGWLKTLLERRTSVDSFTRGFFSEAILTL